jgi:hypothetical protein
MNPRPPPVKFKGPWTLPKLIGWAEYGLDFARTKGAYFPNEEKRADSEAKFDALLTILREARDHRLGRVPAANS